MLNQKEIAAIIERVNNAITEAVNNIVCIIGKLITEPKFNKGVLETKICTMRASGVYDNIPVKMSSKNKVKKGKRYLMIGKLMSEDTNSKNKQHVEIYMWAEEIEEVSSKVEDYNSIYLKGNICKKTELRFTQHEGTPICVSILGVNERKSKNSSYIPIVGWHANAYHIDKAGIGASVILYGRVQSRNYHKDKKQHITYEVSAKRLACM